jgi:8-oxo-dGTP pyrophosphatase MutT (NUDIX family)
MSYLARIRACNNFEPNTCIPLRIQKTTYGYMQPAFAARLTAWPEVFVTQADAVYLHPQLNDYQSRTEAVATVMYQLHQQGIIDTWVNERYAVNLEFEQTAELAIERAATSFFGLKTYGVHVNGLVRKPDGIYVWVGTRALDKPFWPGKLDQIVAGGQPMGLSLLANVVKESQEEANIPAHLAQQAQAVGSVRYQQQGRRGLDNSTIYIYDLWLPEDFVPENTDGEVIQFQLLPLADIARLTEHSTEFKDNCNLVNIDLLLRLGYLNAQHPEYQAIRQALYHL